MYSKRAVGKNRKWGIWIPTKKTQTKASAAKSGASGAAKSGASGTARSRTKKADGDALTKEREDAELRKIWTRSDALRGLKQVVSVSIEAARQEICGEDGEVSEVRFNPSAANAATKAIEAANRLCGYGEEEKEEADDELVICFEDGGELAK